MFAVNSLKTLLVFGIFKSGKSKQIIKPCAEAGKEAATAGKLKTVVDQPGLRILEQVRGDNLFRYETRVINGKPTSTMQVFGVNNEMVDSGYFVNLGQKEMPRISRTKTIQVTSGDSIFGGKKITIDKNYRGTMGMTAHQDKLVKEYTPEGIYEHGERYLKYRHWEKPKITEYNRITFANGQTPYTEALETKKAAEAAVLKAKQEAAAKIAAVTPRVNVGKVFNKNFSELKKIQDETLADGTVVRKFMTKNKNGFSQYIITKDKGLYHEEYKILLI